MASGGWEAMTRAAQSAASRSFSSGTTSETSPISYARLADRRSRLPSSDMRMTSWKGIFCNMWIGSNAEVMP